MALAVGFAPPAAASLAPQTSVPCSTTALASAISGAASGATLVLASGCTYQVSDPLPDISANLKIEGREATLDGDGPETPGYSILNVLAGATLHTRDLNFTCGGNYVGQCGHAIGSAGDVTIDGGTFYDTGPVYNEYGYTDGGAIYNVGQLTVIGATFDGNITDDPGGAIYNDGQLTVVATRFTHNRVVSVQGSGGAIYNVAALTVTSTSITRNTAAAGSPGGIDNEGGTVTLHHARILSNTPFNCSNVTGCTD
jgi:hypothetical protein